jgi:hypothetical protein
VVNKAPEPKKIVIAIMQALAFHKMVLANGRIRQLSLAPMRQMKRTMPQRLGRSRIPSTADVLAAARMIVASNVAVFALRRHIAAIETKTAKRRAQNDSVLAISNTPFKNANLHEVVKNIHHHTTQFAKSTFGSADYQIALKSTQGGRLYNHVSAVRRQFPSTPNGSARLPSHPQSRLVAAMRHVEKSLPSIAPVSRSGGQNRMEHYATERKWKAETDAESAITGPKTPGLNVVDQARLRNALADLLDREARLPPSGATGFDPRLSPAWPGLKLPN